MHKSFDSFHVARSNCLLGPRANIVGGFFKIILSQFIAVDRSQIIYICIFKRSPLAQLRFIKRFHSRIMRFIRQFILVIFDDKRLDSTLCRRFIFFNCLSRLIVCTTKRTFCQRRLYHLRIISLIIGISIGVRYDFTRRIRTFGLTLNVLLTPGNDYQCDNRSNHPFLRHLMILYDFDSQMRKMSSSPFFESLMLQNISQYFVMPFVTA